MKGNFKATSALALLDSTKIVSATKADASKWQKAIGHQINEIARAERMTPRRAVAVGLMLHTVKASLKHGEWRPWLDQMLTELTCWTKGTAHVNASYYMRLAIAFVDEAGPSRPELAVLPSGGLVLDLDGAAGPAAKLVKRLDEFCGESSLQELLQEHGIKSGSSGGGSRKGGEALPADDDTLLEDAGQLLLDFQSLLCDPASLKRFTPKQLDQMESDFESGLAKFRKLKAKLIPAE